MNVCLAQLDRAFGYGPKGRGFESSNARKTLISSDIRVFLYQNIVLFSMKGF